MKIYIVGGYVRDKLLGVPSKDRDFVVVGSSVEEMLSLGYEQVGSSFPVFLKNGEEYALARTERKVGVGYQGFEVNTDLYVSLEEDCLRRDLTINSMAIDPDTNEIIDVYGGRRDLELKLLRHVSDAFGEDPVRVLRTARFAARYNFSVHPDTVELMTKVAPELNHVPQDRIWKEIEKGLAERHSSKMFDVLESCGALEQQCMLPYRSELRNLLLSGCDDHTPLQTKLCFITDQFNDTDYAKLRIPTEYHRICKAFNSPVHQTLWYWDSSSTADKVRALTTLRSFTDATVLRGLLEAIEKEREIECEEPKNYITTLVLADLAKLKTIDVERITKLVSNPKNIPAVLTACREQVLDGIFDTPSM